MSRPNEPSSPSSGSPIYAGLFADTLPVPAPADRAKAPEWLRVLGAARPDAAAVAALVGDHDLDARVRAMACTWLRRNGRTVASKELFGVIVEVALTDGLVVLAAYADGSVRHLDAHGNPTLVEPLPTLRAKVDALLAAGRAVVAQIGPFDRERLPPPAAGRIRLSFLVADGLYFGEADAPAMSASDLGGPVVAAATELLRAVQELRADTAV